MLFFLLFVCLLFFFSFTYTHQQFSAHHYDAQQLNVDGYWFPALGEHAEVCMLPSVRPDVRFMGIQYAEPGDFALHEVFLSLQVR